MRHQILEFFNPIDFNCGCGCGRGLDYMSTALIDKLYNARVLADVPFIINSAFRCQLHNAEVGGVISSAHCLGMAVDIKAGDSAVRYMVIKGAILAGFERIGVYDWGVHVDVDGSKNKGVIWLSQP